MSDNGTPAEADLGHETAFLAKLEPKNLCRIILTAVGLSGSRYKKDSLRKSPVCGVDLEGCRSRPPARTNILGEDDQSLVISSGCIITSNGNISMRHPAIHPDPSKKKVA